MNGRDFLLRFVALKKKYSYFEVKVFHIFKLSWRFKVFLYCFQLSRILKLLIGRKFCLCILKGSETLHSFEADFCFYFLCDSHISMQSSECPSCLSWVPELSIYDGREVSVPRDSVWLDLLFPFPMACFKMFHWISCMLCCLVVQNIGSLLW